MMLFFSYKIDLKKGYREMVGFLYKYSDVPYKFKITKPKYLFP